MNCVCGHSVFDHAKVYKVSSSDPILLTGGWFVCSTLEPTFTLSGPCKRVKETDRDLVHCKCHGFQRADDTSPYWSNLANFWREVCDLDPRPIHGMSRMQVSSPEEFAKTVLGVEVTESQKKILDAVGAGAGVLLTPNSTDAPQRPAKYAEALRDLQETPMRLLTLAEEAIGAGLRGVVESGGTLHGYKPGTVQLITPNPTGAAAIDRGLDAREWREWWKKYDRAPEPGPSEVM